MSRAPDDGNPKSIIDLTDILLEAIDLSTRTRNCVEREQILTIGQLAALASNDVLRWQNAGVKTLKEVRSTLGSLGLKLRDDLIPFGQVDHRLLSELRSPPAPRTDPLFYLKDADEAVQALLVSRISTFDLSVRTRNILVAADITYIGEVAQLSYAEATSLPSCGRKSATEMAELLANAGFELGMAIEDWSPQLARSLEKSLADRIAKASYERSAALLDNSLPPPAFLEEELDRILLPLQTERNRRILSSLWGWNGEPPRTLESVGSEFAITRERVRQIEAKTLSRIRTHRYEARLLHEAINLVRRSIPCSEKTAEENLQSQSLTKGCFSLRSIQKAAHLLAIKWPFVSLSLGRAQVVVSGADKERVSKLVSVCRRRTSEFGCGSISSVCADLGLSEEKAEHVRALLNASDSIVWLDDEKSWLFVPDAARNRLVNLCTKVLSVAPNISLSELRRLVSKSRRLVMVPPQRILARFVESAGLGRREGGRLVAKSDLSPIDPQSLEGKMLRVLDEHGPILDGEEFVERCIAEGINPISYFIYVSGSPVISSLGRNVYAKAGAHVPPGAVEEIVSRRKAAQRPSDHGWTPKGKLWFGLELNRATITAGNLRLPSFVSNLVQGIWPVQTPDGNESGTVTCREQFIWSFRKQFALLGAEPRDSAALEFDMNARSLTIRIGGPDLFESIQASQEEIIDDEKDEPHEEIGDTAKTIPASDESIQNVPVSRTIPRTIDGLRVALAGLPPETRVKLGEGVDLRVTTVHQLRSLGELPYPLEVSIPYRWLSSSIVLINRGSAENRGSSVCEGPLKP